MTAVKLDNRNPLLVIVGAFNPAIFNPFWIARNLHEIPEGAEIDSVEVLAESQNGLAQLSFIDGVALGVTVNRIDAFVLDQSSERIEAITKVVSNLVRVLPHTPLKAIGCNFLFQVEEPDERLLALFDTPEGLEGEYTVRAKQASAQLDVNGDVLNLSRHLANEAVALNFNFHYAMTDPSAYEALLTGLVERNRETAAGILSSIYGLTDYESVGFLPAGQEEVDYGQDTGERAVLENNAG